MHCPHCGKHVEQTDRFCAFCGAAMPTEPAEPDAVHTVAPDASSDSNRENDAEAPNDLETSALKAVVASNRKRARRSMPAILLVALALALTASVALAAYFVYTQVYLPATQEQTQETATDNDAQWDEAVAAYQVIIDDYNEALPSVDDYGFNTEALAEEHPYVNFEPMISLPPTDAPWQYAYCDLNGDGTPELLVGTVGGGRLAENIVYDIWSYQDGEIERVAQGIFRDNYSIRQGNLVMHYGNGGNKVNAYTVLQLAEAPSTDAQEQGSADTFITIEGLSSDWGPTGDTTAYTTYDAEGTIESSICTDDEFYAMLDDLLAAYPEDTDLDWHPLPTE